MTEDTYCDCYESNTEHKLLNITIYRKRTIYKCRQHKEQEEKWNKNQIEP